MLILSNKLKEEIKQKSLEKIPEEFCGLLVDKNNKTILYPCKNISHHPEKFCLLNPVDYIHAADIGKIVGYVHSHENQFTSVIDNFNAFSHSLFSVVYSWKFDKFYIIDPALKSYLNLEFKIGQSDCFTLVRNYYKDKLNIQINDYYRDENWYKKNPRIVLENYVEEGFTICTLNEVRENDIILFGINENVCHMGIYLDAGYILHQQNGKRSIIEELSDKWKDRIVLIVRHKSLL